MRNAGEEQEVAADAPVEASSPEQQQAAEGAETGDLSLEEQLERAREESRQNQERYLRAIADWENFRRRTVREKDELRQHVIGGLLEDFLPVLDNLELGLQTAANHPEAENVAKGFALVAEQIRSVLERHGLTEIQAEGQVFDPHAHESLSYQPHDEIEEGRIVQVIRKGYALNGRLLRAAAVVVSSGPAADDKKDGETESAAQHDDEEGEDRGKNES